MPEQFLEEMKVILKEDYHKLLDSMKDKPKKSIRLQLDKIDVDTWNKMALFHSTKIKELEAGFYIEEEKVGNHPFHHAGLFYVQEPSAMLPPLLAPFEDHFRVLDLCAAPGGKTLSLSNQVPNGFVLANEVNYNRAKKLLSNVERLGLKNVVVSSMTSKSLKQIYEGYFDVILIDAPCSGEGMFRKDDAAKKEWSLEKIEEMSRVGKELLEDSASMLKENGYLIYSTCTFSLKEDEEQIVNFLKNHEFKILDIPKIYDTITYPGIKVDPSYETEKSRRCYPFLYGEGQFMILLQKKCATKMKKIGNHIEELSKEEEHLVQMFIDNHLEKNNYNIKKYQNNIIVMNQDIEIPKMSLLSCFVKMGEIEKNRFIPHHQFVKAYGKDFKNKCFLSLSDERVTRYLKGEEIEADVMDGYGVVMVDGYSLGLFKAKNGRLKNHYPKGLRYSS